MFWESLYSNKLIKQHNVGFHDIEIKERLGLLGELECF